MAKKLFYAYGYNCDHKSICDFIEKDYLWALNVSLKLAATLLLITVRHEIDSFSIVKSRIGQDFKGCQLACFNWSYFCIISLKTEVYEPKEKSTYL